MTTPHTQSLDLNKDNCLISVKVDGWWLQVKPTFTKAAMIKLKPGGEKTVLLGGPFLSLLPTPGRCEVSLALLTRPPVLLRLLLL